MVYPTNPIYKLVKNPITGVVDQVKTKHDNSVLIIPFNEENTDYQEYKKWVTAGNTAEAAD